MVLFHFSDDHGIAVFEPRAVAVPAKRPVGREWLNGPLVWAIDEWHQAMYFFPRDCPRILLWPTDATTAEDRDRWWGERASRMIAYVEAAWMDRVRTARLYRYTLPPDAFEDLGDAGMWVAREAVRPLNVEAVGPLEVALSAQNVELHGIPSLAPLRALWDTTLHVSGIRLRNARDWPSG